MAKWTKEQIQNSANKFSTKTAWRKGDYLLYSAAKRTNNFNSFCSHMKILWKPKWNKETIIAEARKYKTPTEWNKHSGSSLVAAKRLKIYSEAVFHRKFKLRRGEQAWSKEEISAHALKFTSMSEWQKNHPASHRYAERYGWKYELTSHFKTDTNSSKAELEILNFVKTYFPEATKKRFGSPKKGEKGNYFEIDIFIPSLNSGIEFNGTYWHSLDGLKRKLVIWSEEEMQNYHKIKKEFFKKRNITYLDISEAEWKQNKQITLIKILEFLNKTNIHLSI